MQSDIKPKMCESCRGKGILESTGAICEECKGMGATGTDGTQEYYLGVDQNNNVQVLGPKQPVSTSPTKKFQGQKNIIFKITALLTIIFVYGLFALINHFVWQNREVFLVVSVISGGFLFLIVFLSFGVLQKLIRFFTAKLFPEPEDFLTFVENKE